MRSWTPREETIAELRAVIRQLQGEVQELRRENRELKLQLAKANKNSSTSSKAPSSDIVAPPKVKRDRRKKTKAGGQKGHPRKLRQPLPP